jgi:hypothetical protein
VVRPGSLRPPIRRPSDLWSVEHASLIGFALTVVSIQLTPIVAAAYNWQYAFLLLVPGPVLGALAMSRHGR